MAFEVNGNAMLIKLESNIYFSLKFRFAIPDLILICNCISKFYKNFPKVILYEIN